MKKNTLKLTVAALALAFSTSSMAATLATVNGEIIDSNAIDTQVSFIKEQSKNQVQDTPELRQNLLNRMITQTLMTQEARKQKIQNDPEFKKMISEIKAQAKANGAENDPNFLKDLANFENDLLVRGFMIKTVEKNPVTDAQVRAEYDRVMNAYRGTDEVQLAEIVTDKEKDAAAALTALSKKGDFKSIAKKYSQDPEAKSTGGFKQGYIRLKDLEAGAPPLFTALKDLKKGEYTTTPLQSKDLAQKTMYAIFFVSDRKAVEIPKFDQTIQDQIKAGLQNQRIDEAIGKLYKSASIPEIK